MNWTLDGLEEAAKLGADIKSPDGTIFMDKEIFNYLKKLNDTFKVDSKIPLDNIKKKAIINGYRATWLIRYADDFIASTKSQEGYDAMVLNINKFLNERGLEISDEKSRFLKWEMGQKN